MLHDPSSMFQDRRLPSLPLVQQEQFARTGHTCLLASRMIFGPPSESFSQRFVDFVVCVSVSLPTSDMASDEFEVRSTVQCGELLPVELE